LYPLHELLTHLLEMAGGKIIRCEMRTGADSI